MARFEVQTHTLCDGWVNCWSVDGRPMTWSSRHLAELELDKFLADACDANLDYQLDQFRIVKCEVTNG